MARSRRRAKTNTPRPALDGRRFKSRSQHIAIRAFVFLVGIIFYIMSFFI